MLFGLLEAEAVAASEAERKFMHETKTHAKSFRFLYANYSKALEAGTSGGARGEKGSGEKVWKIYASKDKTNKEVGIKTLEAECLGALWGLGEKEYFREKLVIN